MNEISKQHENSEEAPNPFDPASLRLSQDFESSAPVKRVLTIVPVRKPGKQEFVRVRTGTEWRLDVSILEDETAGDVYLVHPSVALDLVDEWKAARLFTAVTSRGDIFLWRCWVPSSGGGKTWHESAMDAVSHAEKNWVRVRADQAAGYYKIEMASGNLAEPEWPEQSFSELLKLAFRDRLIDSLDHPFVKQLRGES